MGFSLSRAIAGAVGGAAHAAGEIFDAQLKEEEKNRARELDLARQKEAAKYADELVSARERSKEAFQERKEKDKRGIYKSTFELAQADLKERGVKYGTVEGQRAMAEAFSKTGYPEFADKFLDNAANLDKATNDHEYKKAQLEANRLAREANVLAREGKISDTKLAADRKVYEGRLDDLTQFQYDADGKKTGEDPTIKHWVAGVTGDIARNDPYKAAQVVTQIAQSVTAIKQKNPRFTPSQVRDEVERMIGASAKQAPAPAAPAAPGVKTVKPRTPGILEKNAGGASGSWDDAQETPLESPLGA